MKLFNLRRHTPRRAARRIEVCHAWARGLNWGFVLMLLMGASAQAGAPRLEILPPASGTAWMRLKSTFQSNTVLTLHASTNLAAWTNIGSLHNALFAYPDAGSSALDRRFYRLAAAPRALCWKPSSESTTVRLPTNSAT